MRSLICTMWRKFFVAGVVFVLLAPITVSAYVTPGAPSGYVNDYAAVMSETERGELESQLSEYEKKTGNEIAVAVIKSLETVTITKICRETILKRNLGILIDVNFSRKMVIQNFKLKS